MSAPARTVRNLVAGITPADDLESAHRADTLLWLESTDDIYRRRKPATPPKHLVAYAALLDPRDMSVFLGEHRLARLRLPPGGHVEPGEDPADTVRREAREELGIEADFSVAGRRPVFVTVARTVGPGGHTDVSLWYAIAPPAGARISLDPREFTGGRWWAADELRKAGQAGFEPHLGRFITKITGTIR